jgi:hypothetical protein
LWGATVAAVTLEATRTIPMIRTTQNQILSLGVRVDINGQPSVGGELGGSPTRVRG